MKYSREFLVTAFAEKYLPLGEDVVANMYCLADDFYDTVDQATFRRYTRLTPAELKDILDVSKN